MTVLVSITGGTSRSAQIEVSFNGVTWIPVGAVRTTVGNFVESIPSAPRVRLNITANVGSTISASVYA